MLLLFDERERERERERDDDDDDDDYFIFCWFNHSPTTFTMVSYNKKKIRSILIYTNIDDKKIN